MKIVNGRSSSRMLIDENPLMVLPSLVFLLGFERAIILQQIQFLIASPNSGMDKDGYHWIWNTSTTWVENYFPFWQPETVKKHLIKLEKDGYIISFLRNPNSMDHTKCYRIDYEFLEQQLENLGQPNIAVHKIPDVVPADARYGEPDARLGLECNAEKQSTKSTFPEHQRLHTETTNNSEVNSEASLTSDNAHATTVEVEPELEQPQAQPANDKPTISSLYGRIRSHEDISGALDITTSEDGVNMVDIFKQTAKKAKRTGRKPTLPQDIIALINAFRAAVSTTGLQCSYKKDIPAFMKDLPQLDPKPTPDEITQAINYAAPSLKKNNYEWVHLSRLYEILLLYRTHQQEQDKLGQYIETNGSRVWVNIPKAG